MGRGIDCPRCLHAYKRGGQPNIEPSMLQDLKRNKPCEIDAINGIVCEWGRKSGVKTPINDRIVEIVKNAKAES